MGFPNPEENTAIDIYQREFSDAEKQQIKLDLFMLDNKESFNGRKVIIANRRLAKVILKMDEKCILQLSDDERDSLNIEDRDVIAFDYFVKKKIRDDIQALLASSQAEEEASSQNEGDVLLFHRPNEK